MPDQNDNVQSKGARLYGLDSVTDTWEPVGVNSNAQIPVNVSNTAAILVDVSTTSPIPVDVTTTTDIPVIITATTPLEVDITNTTNIPVVITATTPLEVDVTNTVAIPVDVTNTTNIPVNISATSNLNVDVQGRSVLVSVEPGNHSASYTATMCIGGNLTVSGVANANEGTVVLESISLVDKSLQDLWYEVHFFNADTSATDHANFDPSDATLISNYLGGVSIYESDYNNFVDNTVATVKNIGLVLKTGSATVDLNAVLLVREAALFSSTADLAIKFGFLQD